MPATLWNHRLLSSFALAIFATSAVACSDDDPVEPEDEPEVQTLTLSVGASTITINKTTGAPSGDLVVPAGASTVTAVWKRVDGSVESLITTAEFELRIVPTTSANLSWVPSGAFGGTLTTAGLASGQSTTAQVSAFHLVEQHNDFGPYTFTVRVE
jgi:hypothetical protein